MSLVLPGDGPHVETSRWQRKSIRISSVGQRAKYCKLHAATHAATHVATQPGSNPATRAATLAATLFQTHSRMIWAAGQCCGGCPLPRSRVCFHPKPLLPFHHTLHHSKPTCMTQIACGPTMFGGPLIWSLCSKLLGQVTKLNMLSARHSQGSSVQAKWDSRACPRPNQVNSDMTLHGTLR